MSDIVDIVENQGNVPNDYLVDVSETKRFLEKWTIDDEFRKINDLNYSLKLIGLKKNVDEVAPFINAEESAELYKDEAIGNASNYPLSVRRYRSFIKEKLKGREEIRNGIIPQNRVFKEWRKRQINRCVGELGPIKANALVHSPVAFELTSGCSVGCWFCGLSSGKLKKEWEYTDENKELWIDTLSTLKEIIGDGIKFGVCYWGTEPFDCSDYEKYIVDFTKITGRCPQTTTAVPDRDINRTRNFLQLMNDLKGGINRFSITSKKTLKTVHENFTAEELTYIELIPQNPEASIENKKANTGRARVLKKQSNNQLLKNNVQDEDEASTISCVSGFIINMPEQQIELITPCPASNEWPLGHWTIDKRKFKDSDDLSKVVIDMIDTHMQSSLPLEKVIRFRKDLRLSEKDNLMVLASKYLEVSFKKISFSQELFNRINEGNSTALEIVIDLEKKYKVELPLIMIQLNEIFDKGLLNEEPNISEDE